MDIKTGLEFEATGCKPQLLAPFSPAPKHGSSSRNADADDTLTAFGAFEVLLPSAADSSPCSLAIS